MLQVVETLQKLIAHEASARKCGSLAEAEAFASKIQNLLITHKLTMSEVEIAAQERDEPIQQEPFYPSDLGGRFRNRSRMQGWMGGLASAIARNFFCRCFETIGKNRLIFVGRATDRSIAVATYRYLANLGMGLCDAECAKIWADAKASDRPLPSPAPWKRSFLLGYAAGIAKRMKADREEIEAQNAANVNAIFHVRKAEADLDHYVRDTIAPRKGRAARPGSYADAAWLGYARGSAVSLNSTAALE